MKKYLLLSIIVFVSLLAKSQSNLRIGIFASSGFQYYLYNMPTTSYGVSIEKKLNNWFGIETGFNVNKVLLLEQYVKIKYNTIPVNVKLYSGILNLSAGLNINFLNDVTAISELKLTSQSLNNIHPTPLGFNISVSKDITLNRTFHLEPFVMLKHDSEEFGANYNIGIKLKYLL